MILIQHLLKSSQIALTVMLGQKTSLSELGATDDHHNGEFRARVQYREELCTLRTICGPSHVTREQAQKDLEQIRKAAEGKSREEGLEMMRNEAQKLKESAQYEAEIRDTLRRRDSKMDESDYEDDDMSDNSEPPWIQEHVEALPESQTDRPTLSPIEATAELSRFKAIKSTPSDLKYLLENRADPNLPLNHGNITPLRNVMGFAKMKHVVQMRELLLQFGATESDDDKARWELRQRADFCEMIRINNEKDIDKDYDPFSASVEY